VLDSIFKHFLYDPIGCNFRSGRKCRERIHLIDSDGCLLVLPSCLLQGANEPQLIKRRWSQSIDQAPDIRLGAPRLIEAGTSNREALLATSRQLGHNRTDVTQQSYIAHQNRKPGVK
jgi:hypothetical protein